MPELPEVEALAAFLRENAVGHVVDAGRPRRASRRSRRSTRRCPRSAAWRSPGRAGTASSSTSTSPACTSSSTWPGPAGCTGATSLPPAPPKPGKGPLALRVHLDDGDGFDLTEQGTRKGLAVYVVRSPSEVPGIARLGPGRAARSTASSSPRCWRGRSGQLKGALTDQTLIAGIGNAYSDEILHAARLSPFKMADKLDRRRTGPSLRRHAGHAHRRARPPGRAEGGDAEGREALGPAGARPHRPALPGLRRHRPRGVSFADTSLQYCPTCQTGGKPLADRRMSKLLR